MATKDTPLDNTQREDLVVADATHTPNSQHVADEQVNGFVAPPHSDFQARGKKRLLDETDVGTLSSVPSRQDSNTLTSRSPHHSQDPEKQANVSVDEVHNHSKAKRPRLNHAECLASKSKSGSPSSGSTTPPASKHDRTSTAATVASLERQPESSTNQKSLAPPIGPPSHCYLPDTAPTTIAANAIFQGRVQFTPTPGTEAQIQARNQASHRKKELRLMKRAAEAQAGRPFVDKRRKPRLPLNEDEQSCPSKELASFSSSPYCTSLPQSDPKSNCSISPTLLQDERSSLPNSNADPPGPTKSLSSVAATLVKGQPNPSSNPTNFSHTMPSSHKSPSGSQIPEPETDQNCDVLIIHDTLTKSISTTTSALHPPSHPDRHGSTSDPGASSRVPADSHTDIVPPKLSFPELKLTPSESEGLSEVVEHHTDLVLKLFEEDLACAQRKHDLEMTRLQSDHKEELAQLNEDHSKEVETIFEAGDRMIEALEQIIRLIKVAFEQKIQGTLDRLRQKLGQTESKSKELQERLMKKLTEQKEKEEQQKKASEQRIANLTGEWVAEQRRLEECIQDERVMRTSESDARKALENEKGVLEQTISQLKKDKLDYEAFQQKLEVWAKQMQVALEKQAEDHQKMMQAATTRWEERVKASLEIGMEKGKTAGFELGKGEVMVRVNELTEALLEAEKERAREKEAWNVEKEQIMEEKRLLEQQPRVDHKTVEELTQQAIRNLDQHWTKEIETRWATLVAEQEMKAKEEQVRRQAEDAEKNSEIENRGRRIAELEEQLKILRQELDDRSKATANGSLGQFSRMEAKSMLEEYTRRGADPVASGSRINERLEDPCHVQ